MIPPTDEEKQFAIELIEKYQLNTKNFSSDRNSILMRDEHIIGLSIQGANDHFFLNCIPSLAFLEELYLFQNGLKTIPNLSKCVKLKKLGLGGNKISKIVGLEILSQLEELELGRNTIYLIEGLDSLSNLKVLNLSWNKITVIENLKKLTNLQSLNLMNNQIREIYGLSYLFRLESLNLRGNQITQITGLENCRLIRTLNLAYNHLEKIENLGHLTHLEEFELDGNPLLPEYEAYLNQSGQYWVNKCRMPGSDLSQNILSFIGYSDSGKTASIESLINSLHLSNRKCVAFKKIHKEGVEFDSPGKNTYRFAEAGAEIVGGQTDKLTGVFMNWIPPISKLIELCSSLITEELSGEDEPFPIILLEGYRDIGERQILCIRSYEDIAPQINSRVVALSGAINGDKDACEKAEREFNLPIIDCLKTPEMVLDLLKK